MIRQTSIECYRNIQPTAQNQRMIILSLIRKFSDGLTRNDISELAGIRINAVAGRVKELLKTKSIYEDGKRIDKYSGKPNYILKANNVIEQDYAMIQRKPDMVEL